MWLFPIQGSYRRTQKYAQNLLGYEKFGLKGHDGVDYAATRGTPVVAPVAGVIVNAYGVAKPDSGGYGNQVRILNRTNIQDIYYDVVLAHFLSVFVKEGQNV